MNTDPYKLISRFLSGEVTSEEKSALQEWLAANAENRVLFEQIQQIWQRADVRQPLSLHESNEAWQEFQQRLEPKSARILPWRSRRTNTPFTSPVVRYLSAAAAILVLVCGLHLFFNQNGTQIYVTNNGERLQTQLTDGTRVHLNHATRLQVHEFSDSNERRVQLTGEAYFEVVPHSSPFIVETRHGRIRVLGTKFNVWGRETATRVAVTEGQVSLHSSTHTVLLSQNEMGVSKAGEPPAEKTVEDAATYSGWRDGKLVFDQTSLTEIAFELQRYYDVTIKLAANHKGDLTLTGTFHNQPIEMVLKSVCLTLELTYTKESGKYVISEP